MNVFFYRNSNKRKKWQFQKFNDKIVLLRGTSTQQKRNRSSIIQLECYCLKIFDFSSDFSSAKCQFWTWRPERKKKVRERLLLGINVLYQMETQVKKFVASSIHRVPKLWYILVYMNRQKYSVSYLRVIFIPSNGVDNMEHIHTLTFLCDRKK